MARPGLHETFARNTNGVVIPTMGGFTVTELNAIPLAARPPVRSRLQKGEGVQPHTLDELSEQLKMNYASVQFQPDLTTRK